MNPAPICALCGATDMHSPDYHGAPATTPPCTHPDSARAYRYVSFSNTRVIRALYCAPTLHGCGYEYARRVLTREEHERDMPIGTTSGREICSRCQGDGEVEILEMLGSGAYGSCGIAVCSLCGGTGAAR